MSFTAVEDWLGLNVFSAFLMTPPFSPFSAFFGWAFFSLVVLTRGKRLVTFVLDEDLLVENIGLLLFFWFARGPLDGGELGDKDSKFSWSCSESLNIGASNCTGSSEI